MKHVSNIFSYIPKDFFKPLVSKYNQEYTESIQLIFRTFQSEISYGIEREIVLGVLEEYFSEDSQEMFFEEEEEIEIARNARDKANIIIRNLRKYGWISYETIENHQVNVVLNEYAIPIIESFERIIREEETEYQGIISIIYSTLCNKELYGKPYELMIKGVKENTDRLTSELKKLNASIKRHMEKQTNEMEASQVLEHLVLYHDTIGSKAYKRMKTSDNLYYFKSEIIQKLEGIISSTEIMKLACRGYMEVEGVEEEEYALEEVREVILGIKSSFYRLDDIVEEIDKKHAKCIKSAVMRAKFLLSSGNNMEGKILSILNHCVSEMNRLESTHIYDEAEPVLQEMIHVYPQRYLESESFKTIPITKGIGAIDEVSDGVVMTEEERSLYKEALQQKNRNRFTRKNINEYVRELLKNQDSIRASGIPISSKRELIRIIYISIYGNNRANCYTIQRSYNRVTIQGYEIPDFEILKSI
ncbi:MAG: DUF5716 family protein [Eubacteriales bacterium]